MKIKNQKSPPEADAPLAQKIKNTYPKTIKFKKYLHFNVCVFYLLSFIFYFSASYWSFAHAMAGKPPAKEEPKYKLEILKMEVVTAPSPSPEALTFKKVLMIIAPKDFQDEEFSKPRELLEAQKVKVTVASSTTNTATGMYGAKVKPDIAIKEAKAADYDAIIFVGGSGASVYSTNPQALALAIEAKKHNKVMGAICIAPVVLAKAGVLEGKKATVWSGATKDLQEAGAIYTGKGVEVDGKIITGKGPAEAEAFGKAILEALKKE